MNYNGAVEYFFYKGVESAQNGEYTTLGENPRQIVIFGGRVTEKCREAFVLGHELGLVMTQADYKYLTKTPNPVKNKRKDIILKKKKDKVSIIDKDYPIKGNC